MFVKIVVRDFALNKCASSPTIKSNLLNHSFGILYTDCHVDITIGKFVSFFDPAVI